MYENETQSNQQYKLARELTDTEQTYVNRLRVLVEVYPTALHKPHESCFSTSLETACNGFCHVVERTSYVQDSK